MAPRNPKAKSDTKDNSTLGQIRSAVTALLKDEDPFIDIDPGALKQSLPCFSTGSIVMDFRIGGEFNEFGVSPCPGIPKGRITNLYGLESSGKTTLALTTAATVCREGGTVVYIDWENALDVNYALSLGVPVADKTKFVHFQPETLEQGFKIAWVSSGGSDVTKPADLVILDSVGAGVPTAADASVDAITDLNRPGIIAAKWSQWLPKLAIQCNRSGTALIGISQLRKKLNMTGYGGDDTTTTGGEAWKYYSSLRLMMRSIGKEKIKVLNKITGKIDDRVGSNNVEIRVDKSKVSGSAHAKASLYITFGRGYDNARSICEIAAANRIVVKGGAWYSWPRASGELKGQGMPAFIREVKKTPGAMRELQDLVWAFLVKPQNEEIAEEEIEVDASTDIDALMGN